MAETLTIRMNGQISATLTSVIGVDSVSDNALQSVIMALNSGTGEGNADQLYSDQRTLAPGASFTTDLATFGGANDKVGNPLAMAKVKLISIYSYGTVPGTGTVPTETNTLIFGGAPAGGRGWVSAFSGTVTLNGTSGWLLYDPGSAGYAVPAGSGNNLWKIANPGSSSIQVNTIIVGATA